MRQTRRGCCGVAHPATVVRIAHRAERLAGRPERRLPRSGFTKHDHMPAQALRGRLRPKGTGRSMRNERLSSRPCAHSNRSRFSSIILHNCLVQWHFTLYSPLLQQKRLRRRAMSNASGDTNEKPIVSEVVFPVDPYQLGNTLIWRISSVIGLGNVNVSPENRHEMNVEIGQVGFLAIWDTGAPRTIVTPSVAEQAKLKPHGMVPITGVTGETRTWRMTRLVVAMQAWANSRSEPHHQFHVVEEAAIAEKDADLGCQVLIGMDVITRGDLEFITDRSGRRVVIWRYPARRRVIRYPPSPPMPRVS